MTMTLRALREKAPPGLAVVGVGLAVNGVSAYGFLVVAGRSLGPTRYAPLAAMWALVFLGGPGFFVPVEQEVGRALAARRARGVGGGPLVRRAAIAVAALAAVLAIAVVAIGRVFGGRLFDHEGLLVAGLAVAIAAYGVEYLARGVLAGNGRFVPYSLLLGSEGVLRLLAAATIAAVGATRAGPYGLAVGLAPLAAVGVGLAAPRRLVLPGPPAPWRELSASLGWLLLGSALSQCLLNGAPLAVKALAGSGQQELAGQFLAGLVMTRVPLFLFQAAQAAVLPRLAALASTGDADEFALLLRRLLTVVMAIGIVMVAGAAVAGHAVVVLLFGAGFSLSSLDLALLACSAAAFMVALAVAQALLAVHRYVRAALGWLTGVGVAVASLVVAPGVLRRVELALVVGCGAAAASMWAAARRGWDLAAVPCEAGGVTEAAPDASLGAGPSV